MSDGPVETLLADLGLPSSFLDTFRLEDDWSMIIKLHALFEAVVAELVVKRLGEPKLLDAVVGLDFNHTKSGKVVFARALDLLGEREASFLRGLSELRNSLVHNIRNVSFNLLTYVKGLDSQQKAKFKTHFGEPICRLKDGETTYAELLASRPATIVLLAGYSCLMTLEFNASDRKRQMLVEALLAHGKK